MSKLLTITIFSMIFAVLSHNYSDYDRIEGTYRRKERMFYLVMAAGLIIFAGLRFGYNDTDTYIRMYLAVLDKIDSYETLFEGIEWLKIGEAPGFLFASRFLAKLGVSYQSYIMLFSIFYISVNLWFFRKYSCNIWLSVFLYIAFAGYTFSLAAIKQCTAMALCLIATDRAFNKKYIQFVLLVAVACLFHAYSFMYLAVPFLYFCPWSKYTLFMLAIFAAVGLGMETFLGALLNVTDMLGETYDANSFLGAGVNPFRLLVTAAPVFLSLLVAKQIRENEDKQQYAIVNLTMLNAELMFVALFGTANYFARLANYFIPFQAVSIPWLLKQYDHKDRRTMTLLAITGYALFFVYSFTINEKFDQIYWSVSLWEYLKSEFGRVIGL